MSYTQHGHWLEWYIGILIFAAMDLTGSACSRDRFENSHRFGWHNICLAARMSVNKKKTADRSTLPIIGWREWIGLPELEIERIKVKVDTGARSSALHAFDLHEFDRDGERWVRFKVHPMQRDSKTTRQTEARVLEYRSVRSSSGRANLRPVIITPVKFLDQIWPIELTLTNRDQMGFRMLLGREAVRNRFLVDSGMSYFGGKPKKKKKKKKTQSSRPGS